MIEGDASLFWAYVVAFSITGVACFGSVYRAQLIDDRDTRCGLVGLLVTSGGWAVFQTAYLVVPTPELKEAAYVSGLIVGLSTVGPWLYFCSAYTGRSLHRNQTIQRVAIGLFLAISLLKITNPLHGLYFTAAVAADPFVHLAVENAVMHWVVLGLAYSLAAVGYFMLFELFWQVDHDSRPLFVLVTLTGLPIIPDLIGVLRPQVPAISFEPIGVALFSLGVLYIYLDESELLQLTDGSDDPVIILDDSNRIREYNASAKELFTELETGAEIGSVAPELTRYLSGDDDVLEVDRVGGMRYYRLTLTPFTTNSSRLGQSIALTDVTDSEQYREELERQNERLEMFAQTVSHDLRNPLDVAMGRLGIAREEGDSEHLEQVAQAHSRMERLIDDVLSLARQGRPINEVKEVRLAPIAQNCWGLVSTGDTELVVESDVSFMADSGRLEQLLENLFRNAIEHGEATGTISIGALDGQTGFYVADEGDGIPESERMTVFEYGYSSSPDGTGFGLAIVKEVVDAHGWSIAITESQAGGARFEVTIPEQDP